MLRSVNGKQNERVLWRKGSSFSAGERNAGQTFSEYVEIQLARKIAKRYFRLHFNDYVSGRPDELIFAVSGVRTFVGRHRSKNSVISINFQNRRRLRQIPLANCEIQVGKLAHRQISICLRGEQRSFVRNGDHSFRVETACEAKHFRGHVEISLRGLFEQAAHPLLPVCRDELRKMREKVVVYERRNAVIPRRCVERLPFAVAANERADASGEFRGHARARASLQNLSL